MNKVKALLANFIAPGIGHFVLKKWIRGVLFLLSSIGIIIWLLCIFVSSILENYQRVADGKGLESNLVQLFLPFVAITILWIYTYIDLIFFCKVINPPETKETNEE